MATNFGSAMTVVGPIGSNEFRTVNVVVNATAGVTGPHAITSGSWNLSVGDNLIVNSAATGVTGYGTGTALVVAGITYAAGTAGTGTVFFDVAASGTGGFSPITVGLADTSLAVPTFSNDNDRAATYSSMNKFSSHRITANSDVELFSWKNQSPSNRASVLVTIDSITDSSGVAIANASVLLQFSTEPNAVTVNRSNLAVLRAGDSFYSSNLSVSSFWGGNVGGAVTQPVIVLKNPTIGTTYYVTGTITIGS